jgi:hypothetical protein
MPGRASHLHQTAAILKVGEVASQAETFRTHVQKIIESPALKSSKRSQEFLKFIVARALDGHFDELKERTLGVELFGRSPSYDTGEDAIVRVTACDVRKRLLQFYASEGDHAELRIELPPGSYIPEFIAGNAARPELTESPKDPITLPPQSTAEKASRARSLTRWSGYALIFVAISSALLFSLQYSRTHVSLRNILPWTAVFHTNGQTQIIFCDPEIVTVQKLLDYSVTLSDYANQRFWPAPLRPDLQNVMQAVSFRGVSVAAVDAAIATKIFSLVVPGGTYHVETHPARSVRSADFKTEDNFILFGSPRSNPWVELYQEQLDFRFEFDQVRKFEFIRNRNPRSGEAASYLPTAQGWGTGQAYAIVALVKNPNQTGHVLILAGSNAEATEAAGRFTTNLDLLSQTMKSHGIDPGGRPQPFEILLRVSTMAGSPNRFEIIACHLLTGKAD